MDEIEISVDEHHHVLRSSGGGESKWWSRGKPVNLDDDDVDKIERLRSPPRHKQIVDLDDMIPPSSTLTTLEDSPTNKDGQGETSSLVDLDVSPESSTVGEDDNAGRDKYAVVADTTLITATEEADDGDEDAKEQQEKEGRCAKYYTTRNIVYAVILFILVIGGSTVLGLFKRGRLDGSKGRLEDIYDDLDDDGSNSGAAMVCNGLESNCDWRVHEVMFAAVHNAMSSREDGFVEWNNLFPLEDALEAGFRSLFLDVCDCPILGVHLCHTLCSGGYRRPVQVFENILSFLQANKGEVVILELQIVDMSLVPLFNVLSTNLPRLMDMMYAHPNSSVPWPYMRDLITSDRRLIVFQHDGPDCDTVGKCPTGVHNMYRYGFETPYDSRGVDELMNTTRTCIASRGDAHRPFMVSNHFAGDRLRLPAYDIALEANQADNIVKRMEDCREVRERLPSLLVVDFWSAGEVVATVQKYNEERGFRTPSPSAMPSFVPSVSPSLSPTISPSTATFSPTVPPSPSPSQAQTVAATTLQPTVSFQSDTLVPSASPATTTTTTTSPSIAPLSLPAPLPTTTPSAAIVPAPVSSAPSPSPSKSPLATTVTSSPTTTPSSTGMSPQDQFPALTGAAMSPPPTSQEDGRQDYSSYLIGNSSVLVETDP
mmetsp:Transcript_25651/g.37517  ORF Transcript_25651/g.37517 Transcript_25651/m.37517 type:complete len:654 (-) Transcript_25651:134-2095(-)